MAHPPWHQSDSYRPRYDRGPPRPPPEAKEAMYHFRGHAKDRDQRRQADGHDRNPNPNPRFTVRAPNKISDRPLLRPKNMTREERVFMPSEQAKFRDLGNMTDSDEAEMEGSDDEGPPHSKRVKLTDTATIESPKWSNPDPYTALPAPNETTGKKMDFVKMIRKARNEVGKMDSDADARAKDFISFGFSTGSDPLRPVSDDSVIMDRSQGAAHPLPSASSFAATEPSEFSSRGEPPRSHAENGQILGKRRRRDQSDPSAHVRPIMMRGQISHYSNAMVLDQWQPLPHSDAAPWLRSNREQSAAIALHREVLDFYEWVRPKDYEFAIRADCLARLTGIIKRFQPGELRAFGSYGAGLFLPTGDMDLVFLESHIVARIHKGEQGFNVKPSPNKMRSWANYIRASNIAKPGSLLAIPHAKVPIIKFIDRVTGLKIDLSFNNDSGLVANNTFTQWKALYPAMPIIVAIIKQFLLIRGLNDVSTGGLGGFSTICLVTSLLQHLPSSGGSQNLGECLLQFLNLYGNHLDRDSVAIRMDPPGYVDKASYGPQLFNKDKKGRLTIIDPHRPDNNISGGTGEIKIIMESFADAYAVLQDQLAAYDSYTDSASFLKELIGGNFDAYQAQRNMLYSLHVGQPGSIAPHAVVPTSLPLAPTPVVPPPHSASTIQQGVQHQENDHNDSHAADVHGSRSSNGEVTARQQLSTAERRALRFKRLRPELTAKIGKTLRIDQAVEVGGYANAEQMFHDLLQIERADAPVGLKPAEKRAVRLKALRPDIANRIGREVNVLDAMKLGGYKSREAMTKDLSQRAKENAQ